MGMPVEPTFSQASFRARDNVPDPGTLDTAFDAGDTALNGDFSYDVDTQFRIRFLIQQTLDTATDNSVNIATEFLLQYNHSASPGWNAVTGSTPIQFALSSGFANHDNTAAQLLGAGTRIDGDALEVSGATDTITFTPLALSETELEVSLAIDSAQVANDETIQLRWLYSAGDEAPPTTILEDYSNTPTITVVEGISPVSVPMVEATLVSSAQALNVDAPITIPITAETLVGSPQVLSVLAPPPPQNVPIATITLSGSVQAFTVLAGEATVPMQAITLAGSAQVLTTQAGEVTIPILAITLSGSAEALIVLLVTIISMQEITAVGSPQSLDVSTPSAGLPSFRAVGRGVLRGVGRGV